MSAARKTNVSLAVVVVIIAGAISVAAVFGDRTSEVVPNAVTTSTSTTNPVGDPDSEETPITSDTSGARPANLGKVMIVAASPAGGPTAVARYSGDHGRYVYVPRLQ